MASRQHPVYRHILIEPWQHVLASRRVPPITHQITHDAKRTNELHTRLLHARIRRVTDECRGGARGLDVGEDGVALGAEGEREEGGADVGCDATNDDLGLVCCFDGGAEVGIIPSAVGNVSGLGLYAGDRRTYSTSPWRLMSGASGYISNISLGSGPLGPCWAEVVMTTGRSNNFPMAACAIMFSR